jgi:hypothetical protein
MVDLIDAVWLWIIPKMPTWKLTSLAMRIRHNWYLRFRVWNESSKQWVKR